MTCLHCGLNLKPKVYGVIPSRKESPGELSNRKYCDVQCSRAGRTKRRCIHEVLIGEPCLFCDRVRRVAA